MITSRDPHSDASVMHSVQESNASDKDPRLLHSNSSNTHTSIHGIISRPKKKQIQSRVQTEKIRAISYLVAVAAKALALEASYYHAIQTKDVGSPAKRSFQSLMSSRFNLMSHSQSDLQQSIRASVLEEYNIALNIRIDQNISYLLSQLTHMMGIRVWKLSRKSHFSAIQLRYKDRFDQGVPFNFLCWLGGPGKFFLHRFILHGKDVHLVSACIKHIPLRIIESHRQELKGMEYAIVLDNSHKILKLIFHDENHLFIFVNFLHRQYQSLRVTCEADVHPRIHSTIQVITKWKWSKDKNTNDFVSSSVSSSRRSLRNPMFNTQSPR